MTVSAALAARGIPVSWIELSQPMIDQLRQKATAEELPVVQGDMTVTTVPGGRFVVELGVPSLRRFTAESECHVSVWRKR